MNSTNVIAIYTRLLNTWAKIPKRRQKLIIENIQTKIRARLQATGLLHIPESTTGLPDGASEEELTKLFQQSIKDTENEIATNARFPDYSTQVVSSTPLRLPQLDDPSVMQNTFEYIFPQYFA